MQVLGYPGLNYTSEETCDPCSRPWKRNSAIWKPLTVTGGDDKSEIGLHVGIGQGSRKAKPQADPDLTILTGDIQPYSQTIMH